MSLRLGMDLTANEKRGIKGELKMSKKEYQVKRSKIQDLYLEGKVSRDECVRQLDALAAARRQPTQRDKAQHLKFMALYAPIEK